MIRTEGHPIGHVTREVLTRSPKPLVVVPPAPAPAVATSATVVVPLDGLGTVGSAGATRLGRLARGGADLALRIVHPATAPRYWDHFDHDFPAWYGRLLATCPFPGARVELGRGSVVQETLRVADEAGAALIALPWSHELSSGQGALVTDLLRTTRAPVLLVPAPAELRRPASIALTSAA